MSRIIILNVIDIVWDDSRLNFIYLKAIKTALQIESFKPNVKSLSLRKVSNTTYTLK